MVYRWWLHAVGIFILSSSLHKRESEMSRTVLLVLSTAVAILVASGAVLALPSEKPDKTPMVNGTVRAIEQVGTNLWLGGKFTQVERHKGTVVANVSNLAVFDSKPSNTRISRPSLAARIPRCGT